MLKILNRIRAQCSSQVDGGADREACRKAGLMVRRSMAAAAMLLAALSLATVAQAQGSRKDDVVFNAQAQPMAGATVRVCTSSATGEPCSPLANIYSDVALTQALANPTTTDGLGNYSFYAAPGRYMIEISGPNITTKQIPNVILPNDPSVPTFTTVTTTSGISAFSLSLSGNLTVSGSAAVTGTLTVGGAPIPSAAANNQFTGVNSWTKDPIFGSTFPWTDVRINRALCDGMTDDATAYGATYTTLKNGVGGTIKVCNDIVFTPPSETFGGGWITASLDGLATVKGTWTMPNTFALVCGTPQMNASNPFFVDQPTCPLQPNSTSINPVIATSGAQNYLKDLDLANFGGTGVKIAGNDDRLIDIWSENTNSAETAALPFENTHGTFGLYLDHGGCAVTTGSTVPCIEQHTSAIAYIDHTFMSAHGYYAETATNPSAGPNCGDTIFNQQLMENALNDGSPFSSMYTFQLDGCPFVGEMIENPNFADQISSTTPLINVTRATGTYQINGISVDYPDGLQGPLFQTPSTYGSFVLGADVRGSATITALGLYGQNAYHYRPGKGGDVWNYAGVNNAGTFVGGVEVGMPDPQSISCTPSASGGSFAAGTYYVVAAGEDSLGNESVLSYEVGPFTLTGSSSSIGCSFHASPGSVATRFYVGTSRGLGYNIYYRTTNTSSFTITGSGGVSQNPTQIVPNTYNQAATDCLGPACSSANYPNTTTEYVGTAGCLAVGKQACTSDTTPGDVQIAGKLAIGGGVSTAFSTKSSAYTLTGSDAWVNVTGTTTITVPHAVVGQRWDVFNSGSGTVTIQVDSGNVNGAANITLSADTGKSIVCDGSNCFAH